MNKLKTLYLTGYRSFEVGVFKDKDPKIQVIKKVLKEALRYYAENGLEWVLTSGNLGVELWGAEVVSELKSDFPDLNLGIIFPFSEFGSQWNETNQAKLQMVKQLADYVNSTSHQPYKAPDQLRNHTSFLLEHSNGTLMVYDKEFPGKPKFFVEAAEKFSENSPYLIHLITMDDLQNSIETF
ncbi:hypothetical protein BAU15_12185 [Enterococcus sp. JM4C]|uniref:DUF1273 domain-containing protein n=1 Tax=Candidatus Enterococcus huntleyi TaxID=1857217 RepID=UPI00137AF3F9|nr:DUF1273 domain-containing protein [Enterococcus sp. JM4C]KAF1296037.1 hypothetical protein BAU15_12185 [Enterococcus sp. JM4C]